MDWKTHKKNLLKNPKFVQALEESQVEFEIARAVIEARLKRGMSQMELAQELDTKQSVISRLENLKTTPSLSFLKRVAHALDMKLSVQLQ